MSLPNSAARAGARPGWALALAVTLAGVLAMGIVATLGLWAAGATDIPDGAFPKVVVATVVAAVGGSVELSGSAGRLAGAEGGLTVIPLSVTLVGALVFGAGFLWPLRHRAVAGAGELAGWAARIGALWLLALMGLALGARHTFTLSLGDGLISDLGELFGLEPEVGFTTDAPLTLVFGVLWLAGVLVVALLVTRGVPLPGRVLRFQEAARPAAYAMVALLLAYVVLGVVIALVVAVTRGHPVETLAVVLLGLPNLVWPALTIGTGATWDGRVEGPFALPMPNVLDRVMRSGEVSAVDLGTLGEHDGRVWWLLPLAAVLLSAAACLMAVRSPAGVPLWRQAAHMAVALLLTVLMICLLGRISAAFGLTVLGIGDLGGDLSQQLFLRPRWWGALGLALLWGLVTGFLGALVARWLRRPGEVRDAR